MRRMHVQCEKEAPFFAEEQLKLYANKPSERLNKGDQSLTGIEQK